MTINTLFFYNINIKKPIQKLKIALYMFKYIKV